MNTPPASVVPPPLKQKLSNASETTTEAIFRDFFGSKTFIEKSAIPKSCGFKSKHGTPSGGYPDFYKDAGDFVIVVEAKALLQKKAEKDVLFYLEENRINRDLIGIALSGQSRSELRVSYFHKCHATGKTRRLDIGNTLLPLDAIEKIYEKSKYGETVTDDELKSILQALNNVFHRGNKVRDTDRSLFFAGLMIALSDNNFRRTYQSIEAPSRTEKSTVKVAVLEAHKLNNDILDSISSQLENKIDNLSKEFCWRDRFSFIKTIDYPLEEYKRIIETIEAKILVPFRHEEKQDILGRAYKIFLSRAGKVDSKNIILTPDHIKGLMVKLARLHEGDVVLDTCTGSGGFLMEAMETMIRLAGDNPKKVEEIKTKQLIGFEIDSVLFALACSNMFLHGDGRTNLLYRSSLLMGGSQEGIIRDSGDRDLLNYITSLAPTKCIINPPYEKNSSILFVKQALEYLQPSGKLVVIMPKPTLSHNAEGITQDILKVAKLDYVIKMPTRLFAEQKRTVNTAIFGFTKTPHQKSDEVLFYDLEDDGHVSVQHRGRVDKGNRWKGIEDTVLDAISNGREIREVCEKRKIYLGNVLICAGVRSKRSGNYGMVRIGDLFDLQKGSLASEEARDGDYDFITASEDWKKHDSYDHDCEALVYAVAASGSLSRSHYVKGKFVASNLCLVLTPKKGGQYKLDLRFYNCYFEAIRKRIASDLADGTSKLTISKEDFENYYIDYVPLVQQASFVKQNLCRIDAMKNDLANEIRKIESDLRKLF